MSVWFAGLGRALPTFSFGFYMSETVSAVWTSLRLDLAGMKDTWKSFFFSFFFLALDPILAACRL